MNLLRVLAAFSMSLSVCACVIHREILDPAWDRRQPARFEDHLDQYFFGFAGGPAVSYPDVCMDEKPLAAVWLKNFEDVFLEAVTLGIYAPTTVRVWCGKAGQGL